MKLKFYSHSLPSNTHPEENQDALFIDQKNKAAGIFDGIGGLAYGGQAAMSAAEFCKIEISQVGIEKTLENCHRFLKEKGKKEFGKEIATTAAVAQIYLKQTPALIVWGSVGDSRIYHLSSTGFTQASVDDSLITQAMENGWVSNSKAEQINQAEKLRGLNKVEKNLFQSRNLITQALGIGVMTTRVGKFKARKGDRVVLTSDGVHNNLTNLQIEQILKNKPADPAKKLVEEAIFISETDSLRAKSDDMTAVVVELLS